MADSDLNGLSVGNNEELRQHFDTAVARIEATSDAAAARSQASAIETRRHFDLTAERLERKIQTVIDTVAQMGQKFDRRIDDLEARMNRGFADTQAVLKAFTR